MIHFREDLLFYIAAAVAFWGIFSGVHRSKERPFNFKNETVHKVIALRIIDMGGNFALKEIKGNTERMKEKAGNTGGKSNKEATTSKFSETEQPRRRSGCLANRYWKDLSGISSKTDPIILDSDSGEDEEEKGKQNGWEFREVDDEAHKQAKEKRLEQTSSKGSQPEGKGMKQIASKGKRAGHGGQDAEI